MNTHCPNYRPSEVGGTLAGTLADPPANVVGRGVAGLPKGSDPPPHVGCGIGGGDLIDDQPTSRQGNEHLSIWLREPGTPAPGFITAWANEPWPEFIEGFHYDFRQPSRLLPLLARTTARTVAPSKALCRCGSTTYLDVPIHDGQSVRRDCGGCGRFIEFPIWYGTHTGQFGQQSLGYMHGDEANRKADRSTTAGDR